MNGLKLCLCVHCRVGVIRPQCFQGSRCFRASHIALLQGVAAAIECCLTGGKRERLSNEVVDAQVRERKEMLCGNPFFA